MHINNPLQQKSSGCVTDLRLHLGNVVVIDHELDLFPFHVFKVLLGVLGHGLRVFHLLPVDRWHLLHFIFKIILYSCTMNSFDSISVIVQSGNCRLRWSIIIAGNGGLHNFVIVFFVGCIEGSEAEGWWHVLVDLHTWSVGVSASILVLQAFFLVVGWIPE